MGAPRAVFGALAEKATVKKHKENAEHRTLNAQHRMEESAICNLSPLTSLVTAASGNPIIRRSTFDVQRSAFSGRFADDLVIACCLDRGLCEGLFRRGRRK